MLTTTKSERNRIGEYARRRFRHVGEVFVALADQLEPQERLTVSECAAKHRFVNQPGAYIGPWENSTTPYMVEPADLVAQRQFSGLIFVGPAQSGKTDALIVNSIAYHVKVDPLDLMLVCPTQAAARDFSFRRIDRLHRHSEAIGAMTVRGRDKDSTYSKAYSNGMILTLSWPSPTELAGKPIGRVFLTDRDRMVDDVDGGEPFDLAQKRTTTFGSYAMTVCESSPSRPVIDARWIASTPHEAPPCGGIMSLYNRGDRRRWYWPCPNCENYFEGKFRMLEWDREPGMSNVDAGDTVRLICPFCAHKIKPADRQEMQLWGRWVGDNQGIDKRGRLIGNRPRSRIASFWLNGMAAAFTNWKQLVALYLDADDDYNKTTNEESLVKFSNNDLGEPYIPKSVTNLRLPETLKARAENLGEKEVPEDVRFLVATVDVQKNQFIVQVHGIMPGMPFDMCVIDRFDIRKSKRLDHDGERLWVKPHAYIEDWGELIENVLDREYPIRNNPDYRMPIRMTGCDSGGRHGVTTMAYRFYRELRNANAHRRFVLIKGDPSKGMPRTRLSYPDSSQRDALAAAQGDVPVLLVQPNILKDDLEGRLNCVVPGKGMFRFPNWLPDSFYAELCTEIRTAKGWENKQNHRNESWDLAYYCIGLCVSQFIQVEHLDWSNPPGWAMPFDKNDMVRKIEKERPFAAREKPAEPELDFADLAKQLA